jgi:hypothetical protein
MTPQEGRALKILADAGQRCGALLVLMIAQGLSADLLSGLMRDGLAMMSTDTVSAGSQTIEATILRITDAGRAALWCH